MGHLRHSDFLAGGAIERIIPGAFGPAPAEAAIGFELVSRYTHHFLQWHLTGLERSRSFLAAPPETNGAPPGLLQIERIAASVR
jgi:hypothetical protein